MEKDILDIIKNMGASRRFEKKEIPDKLLTNIIEAGIWGLSILGIQPWKIICIKKKSLIKNIADLMSGKASEIEKPFGAILKLTSITVANSNVLIAVYNTKKVFERAEKYGESYKYRARMAELQVIGGVIQNMLLEAHSLGLGSVWMDSPTFFNEKEINDMLNQSDELIAILAFGYPSERTKRSARGAYNQMAEVIE